MIEQCRLLAAIGEELEQTRPFDGLTIGTGIHLEPKTVALLLTLLRGGAKLVSTGNLNTTQQEAVDYLAARGVQVVGRPTQDAAEHDGYLWEVVRSGRSCCSTTAATCSRGSSRSRTTACSAAPRRRPPAACASSRCATRSAYRCS